LLPLFKLHPVFLSNFALLLALAEAKKHCHTEEDGHRGNEGSQKSGAKGERDAFCTGRTAVFSVVNADLRTEAGTKDDLIHCFHALHGSIFKIHLLASFFFIVLE